jgi:AcrR family transcriptional regulator
LVKTKSSRLGRPSYEESIQQRERIFTAALEHFIANGYSKTTMEGIAKSANVAKQTVYSQHADKRTLFFRVIERFRDPRADVTNVVDQYAALPFAEGLHQIALGVLTSSHAPKSIALYKLVQREAHAFPELADMFMELNTRLLFKPLEGYMAAAKKAGELNLVTPAQAVQWFIYLVFGEYLRRGLMQIKPMTQREVNAHVDIAVKLFLNGVRSK